MNLLARTNSTKMTRASSEISKYHPAEKLRNAQALEARTRALRVRASELTKLIHFHLMIRFKCVDKQASKIHCCTNVSSLKRHCLLYLFLLLSQSGFYFILLLLIKYC